MSRITQLQAFLEKDPTDSFTRYAIGLEYAKEKNFLEATRQLEELRTQTPDYIPTYYMLASYYRELGEREQAFGIYKEGIMRARQARDHHAAAELEAALDELEDEM